MAAMAELASALRNLQNSPDMGRTEIVNQKLRRFEGAFAAIAERLCSQFDHRLPPYGRCASLVTACQTVVMAWPWRSDRDTVVADCGSDEHGNANFCLNPLLLFLLDTHFFNNSLPRL